MAKSSLKKAFADYELYIFDLDGTLYYQKQLRLVMARRLALYYLAHPFRIKELFIVKKFREVREKWDGDAGDTSLDEAQYKCVAEKMGSDTDTVRAVIKRWIYDNPLDALLKSRDSELAGLIGRIRDNNKSVVIFSDYPVEEKLSALGIEADGMFCSADEPIKALKPSPKGIEFILSELKVSAQNAVMIGDRMEKDGLSAQNAGVDFIILDKSKSKRCELYRTLMKL